jgi:hypothetical protein
MLDTSASSAISTRTTETSSASVVTEIDCSGSERATDTAYLSFETSMVLSCLARDSGAYRSLKTSLSTTELPGIVGGIGGGGDGGGLGGLGGGNG